MKTIKVSSFTIYDIKGDGSAVIKSSKKLSKAEGGATYKAAIDALESHVLALYCEGVDVTQPAFARATAQAIEAIQNNLFDYDFDVNIEVKESFIDLVLQADVIHIDDDAYRFFELEDVDGSDPDEIIFKVDDYSFTYQQFAEAQKLGSTWFVKNPTGDEFTITLEKVAVM